MTLIPSSLCVILTLEYNVTQSRYADMLSVALPFARNLFPEAKLAIVAQRCSGVGHLWLAGCPIS